MVFVLMEKIMSIHENPLYKEPGNVNHIYKEKQKSNTHIEHSDQDQVINTSIRGNSLSFPSQNSKTITETDSVLSAQKHLDSASPTAKEFKISKKRFEKGLQGRNKDNFQKEMKLNLGNYKEKFENFEKNRGNLIHKKTQANVGLTAKQLMKVTAKGLTVLKETGEATWVSVGLFNNKKVLVVRGEGGELQISKKERLLGEGANGVVRCFKVVTEGMRMAGKFTLPKGPAVIRKAKKEITIMNHVYADVPPGQKVEGLTGRPASHQVTKIISKNHSKENPNA